MLVTVATNSQSAQIADGVDTQLPPNCLAERFCRKVAASITAALVDIDYRIGSRCQRHIALMSVVNALGARNRPPKRTAVHDDDRVWVEAELKDVGDQALMRGLATAFPIVRPGL
ncbi:hypothetical protein U8Q05_30210 (plasmid) [Rhizobium ruizarguesonis]|nr:hypothetical protein U8Q05_30210 [Rhizobium ruizarguesonis]